MGLFKRESATIAQESSEWPSINTLVWVRLPCCETTVHPSRVEDRDGQLLVVAHPQRPHPAPVPPPDSDRTFIIGWQDGNDSKQARAQLVEVGTTGPLKVATWSLKQVSKPEKIQRRQFVRAGWNAGIVIHFPATDVTGKIADISEAGIRCIIKPMPEPRSPFFQVSFSMVKTRLVLETEIAWWGSPGFDKVEIGLQFIDPGHRVNDQLRAFTFQRQLANRNNETQ